MNNGKIIHPAFPGSNSFQELSVKLVDGGIDCKFNGKPEVIIDMLYICMEQYPHIAKTIISTALIFADKKKIPLSELQKHSYITGDKIIIDP